MFRNYFKIAWRNLAHNKAYSAINIIGLAVGITVVMLITTWILDETNYNKQFAHYDRIVQIMHNSTHGTETSTTTSQPIPLAGELRTKYASDFVAVALSSGDSRNLLVNNDQQFNKKGMFVQQAFIDIFAILMLSGSSSLTDPTSILLSQSMATALFGSGDALGKTLKMDNKNLLKVTGVYADMPNSSNFREVDFLAPWDYYVADQSWVKNASTEWNDNGFEVFGLLREKADLASLSAKVRGSLEGHERKDKPEVLIFPMSRWHLYAEYKHGKNTGGAIEFVWMFGIIGLFVMLLACINFMNLSTARSERRAKEVGIRKAIGSMRG